MNKIIYLLTVVFLFINNVSAAKSGDKELDQAGQNANALMAFFSIEMLINIIFAIIAIVMTLIISKVLDWRIKKFIETWWTWENREELAWVLSRIAHISVLAVWFTIVLSILGIDMGIFLWGLWFWIWFTLKIFLSNFIAWIIMVTQWSYHNWDVIEIGSTSWTIKKINSLFTAVEQFNWVIFFVPNVKFLEDEVKNFHANDKRRVEIEVWVDYQTDILKAKKIMLQVIENFPWILRTPESNVFITKFDDSSINLSLRFWINSKWEYFATRSNVTETINLAFKQYWIHIPFPQITLSNRSDFKMDLKK